MFRAEAGSGNSGIVGCLVAHGLAANNTETIPLNTTMRTEPAMRIALLHTIESNRAVFAAAADALGLAPASLTHDVRADLREAVDAAGGATPEIEARTRACLTRLSVDAQAVLVTCATLGPIVDALPAVGVPVIRADAALAQAAARAGSAIVVLCAAGGALAANRRLFESCAGATGATVEVVHVPQVWATFTAGDMQGAYAATASAADLAYSRGADVVAFAHPWMAPAKALVTQGRAPLDSAVAALQAVIPARGDSNA